VSIADVAAELRALAERVRRLPPPMKGGDPTRFYEEQSEIAGDLAAVAERMVPSRPASNRSRALVSTVRFINGRKVVVQQSPRPGFSVFIGGKG
jgi:hypothetical protein